MAKSHDKEESQGSHGGGGGGHGAGAGGHGGGEHEESGAPEWLISFADNVALLMGFFVILLAMNMKEPTAGGIGGKEKNGGAPPSAREMDVIIGIREAFNQPINMDSDNPAEARLAARKRERALAGQSLQPEEPGEGRESQVKIPTQMSALGGTVPFEDDAEVLTDAARDRAERIGVKLKGINYVIDIRGHASPSEAQRDPEKANNLSHRRAMAVARVLHSQGLTWEQMRLSSAGSADSHTDREYDREANRVNQRVEVIVTADLVK